jgi:hypothetical protein
MKGRKLLAILPLRANQGLSNIQAVSLETLDKHLDSFDKALAYPESHPPGFDFPGWRRFPFRDYYFGTYNNYSRLLLSRDFYQRALGYDWILVVHLDVLLFGSPDPWLSMEEDYVGAPWFEKTPSGELVSRLAGNGGLSLHRVDAALRTLNSRMPFSLGPRRNGAPRDWKLRLFTFCCAGLRLQVYQITWLMPELKVHEDRFWSHGASAINRSFHVVPPERAVYFSWETHPRKCYEMTKGKLPFGVHAWEKYEPQFIATIAPLHLRERLEAAIHR